MILLVPNHDRELRTLRDEQAWMAACAAMRHLDVMTSTDYGRPITDVMPMGGLLNVDAPAIRESPRSSPWATPSATPTPRSPTGSRSALAHAEALGRAAGDANDVDELAERYRADVMPEAASATRSPATPTSERPTLGG